MKRLAVVAEPEWLTVHCGDCDYEWKPLRLPAPIPLVVKAMKGAVCPSCHKKNILHGPSIKPWNEGDLLSWLRSGDTGTSSETIASVLSGKPEIAKHIGSPHDPADFGRCYRLLAKMPGWRERLPEVSAAHPDWIGLVNAWDELTTLWELESPTGMCKRLYDRMQELRMK